MTNGLTAGGQARSQVVFDLSVIVRNGSGQHPTGKYGRLPRFCKLVSEANCVGESIYHFVTGNSRHWCMRAFAKS